MADEDDDVIVVDADQVDDGKDADKPLGAAGQKAFEALKAKRTRDIERREAAETRAKELESELERLKGAGKDDDKPDVTKLREQAKAEARAEALKDRVLDKIEAKAAKLFADPEDAVALLGRRVDEFVDDGKLDVEAIQDALDELLKKKPHLAAAAQGTAKRFSGTGDGGARNGSGRPAQLTEQDLKRMTPEAIVKARADGRLDDLMGVT